MSYLKHDEFVDLAPDEVGSVRVNHESDDCSGTSKSLKIERKEDGSIRAKCFRCGLSGIYNPEFKRVREAQGANKPAYSVKQYTSTNSPRDITSKTSEWPVYAINWLRQWGITNEEINTHHISYSPFYDRLCFSIYFNGLYSGYVSRAVNPKDDRPKWLRFTDGKPWYKESPSEERGNILVLVEDVVSAIRVNRYADSIALLTTTISGDILTDLIGYDTYIIWLDNDNKLVKLNQLKLARRLSLLGNTRVVHSTDPKRLSDETINAELTR